MSYCGRKWIYEDALHTIQERLLEKHLKKLSTMLIVPLRPGSTQSTDWMQWYGILI